MLPYLKQSMYMGHSPIHTGRECQYMHVHKETSTTKPELAVP